MRTLTRTLAALVLIGCTLTACGPVEGVRRYGAGLPTPVRVLPRAAAAAPVLERRPAVTFAVWSPGGIRADAERLAPSLDGVEAAGRVATGTAEIRGVRGATKDALRRRTVTVVAVSPEPLAYDPAFAPLAGALEQGYAGVHAASASSRGVGLGAVVKIAQNRAALAVTVGSVVPTHTLFDRELVLPLARARGFRLGTKGLIVAARPDAFARVRDTLVRAAGPGARARPLVVSDHAANGMVISPDDLEKWFGSFSYVRGEGDAIEPDPRWVRVSIVDYTVPVLGRVRCHRNIIPQLWYAMWEIQQQGLADQIDSYDGCYVPRMQRGDDTQLSAHAYGIAIDLNAAANGMGDSTPAIDARIVNIMEKWGFYWGGRFRVPDGMHFEFQRFVRLPKS